MRRRWRAPRFAALIVTLIAGLALAACSEEDLALPPTPPPAATGPAVWGGAAGAHPPAAG